VVRLQRKPPGATVERLGRRDNADFAALRSQAARWAADNFDKLADPDPKMPDLNDRAADNWRPLLAIADLAGGSRLAFRGEFAGIARTSRWRVRIVVLGVFRAVREIISQCCKIGASRAGIGLRYPIKPLPV
jgi:hypothetical protein